MTLLFAIVGDPSRKSALRRSSIGSLMNGASTPSWFRCSFVRTSLQRRCLGLRKVENLAGLIVTVPHKASAAQLLNKASSRVKIANAVERASPMSRWLGG